MPGHDAELLSGKGRKGTVLLDERVQPRATVHFYAFMILTNGQWPPRGLLTGCWPPSDAAGFSDVENAAEAATDGALHEMQPMLAHMARPTGQGKVRSTRKAATYSHVIHCGSMRQEAKVVAMEELSHELPEHHFPVDGGHLSAAAAAAAVLLGGSRRRDAGHAPGDYSDCAGTLVKVCFRFTGRQEWLMPGMRFVVRDQQGNISGVGVVRSTDET